MKKPIYTGAFARWLGVLALAACAPDAAAPPVVAAPARVSSYRYDGVAGSSQVTQQTGDGGRESLLGTTDLAAGVGGRVFAKETVRLDARGRLEHAEIVVGTGPSEARYTLEPARGAVRVERPGSAPFDWRVPIDAPWLYAPPLDGRGDLLVTPVGAWVALRAAGAAQVVRVLEPEQQRSYLVLVDQVAVATERGTTVALGYDGVDVDDRFVTELRLFHDGVTLARVAAVDLGA